MAGKLHAKFCTEGPQSASPSMKKGSWPPGLQPFCTSAHALGWSKILQHSRAVCRETSHCNLLNSPPGKPLRLPWDESWSWLFHSPAPGAEFRAHCVSDLCKPWHAVSSCACCLTSWKVNWRVWAEWVGLSQKSVRPAGSKQGLAVKFISYKLKNAPALDGWSSYSFYSSHTPMTATPFHFELMKRGKEKVKWCVQGHAAKQ